MARILVVDDDDDIRRLVATTLFLHGHEVVEAESGEEAIEKVESDTPDLVVLDVMMPGMTGWEVLKEMRNRGLKGSTRVLMLTAKTQETDYALGFKLGADAYVTKPFDPDEFALSVSETLMLSPEQLIQKRNEELDKANLLSRVESIFEEKQE